MGIQIKDQNCLISRMLPDALRSDADILMVVLPEVHVSRCQLVNEEVDEEEIPRYSMLYEFRMKEMLPSQEELLEGHKELEKFEQKAWELLHLIEVTKILLPAMRESGPTWSNFNEMQLELDQTRRQVATLQKDVAGLKEAQMKKAALEETLKDLYLSKRTELCLERAGLTTVGKILAEGIEELRRLHNFGEKSAAELEDRLNALGFSLYPDKEAQASKE